MWSKRRAEGECVARNPWLALDASTDPIAHSRLLRALHERLLGGALHPARDVRRLVADSWRRSLAAGVTPDAPGAPVLLSDDDLASARENSPLAGAVETILQTLGELDLDAGHVVAIGDAQANLLWVRGHPRAIARAREMRFEEGAAWSENAAGTNALGTAVAIDHAVQIFSAEHLVQAVHAWTCSAAPIHDPLSGQVIGVVDLTSELRSAHPHTLSLAALAAQAAESKLRLDSMLGAHTLGQRIRSVSRRPRAARRPRLRLRLLGNDARATIGTSAAERGLRSLELLGVLAMHPEGMTAEQLALALYGERGKTVTVRAQVHRVRANLGEQTVATQPYRLAAGVDADWLEVQKHIAAGRPDTALRAYRGSLLPGSEAPSIVEARRLLEESLRRSILTTANPDLLSRWLAHPGGADDIVAARALVAVLPPGDSRRAAATATISAIARRLGIQIPLRA
jgi:transcriptional regulator of acetoin/glycerol metabolism